MLTWIFRSPGPKKNAQVQPDDISLNQFDSDIRNDEIGHGNVDENGQDNEAVFPEEIEAYSTFVNDQSAISIDNQIPETNAELDDHYLVPHPNPPPHANNVNGNDPVGLSTGSTLGLLTEDGYVIMKTPVDMSQPTERTICNRIVDLPTNENA